MSEAIAQYLVGQPTKLESLLESPGPESQPELSSDGLTLYFTKRLYAANPDISVATRDSLDDPWMNARPIGAPINTSRGDASPAISPDGRELYFDDGNRAGFAQPVRPGGMGGPDIWLSSYNEQDDSWGEPQNLGLPINSRFADFGPNLSADGLELYYSSDRPGGSGATDIWVTRRSSVNDAWNEPVNLGPTINGTGHDLRPAISPDGRILVFGSWRPGGVGRFSLWASMRERIEDDWGTSVYLGTKINDSDLGADGASNPDFSSDGATLMYNDNGMWEVSLSPLEPVSLIPGAGGYQQTFDEALGIDGKARGTVLPTGWTVSDHGIIFGNETDSSFPVRRSLGRGNPILNAGFENGPDRTLAIGVNDRATGGLIQLLTQVNDQDAESFQLQFDVEAWDARESTRTDNPGEAAFQVEIDIDRGEGFESLLDLGTVTTGPLSTPTGEHLNGNATENRIAFDSGIIDASIPVGSMLRVRWLADREANTQNWVFGVDNVSLSLSGAPTVTQLLAGDADQDLDFDQLDLVRVQVANKYLTGEAATWGDGDWNGAPGGSPGNPPAGDGLFNQIDVIAAQQGGAYLTGPYATVEPGGKLGDGQASVIYNAGNGEVAVDAPAGVELTSINIDSVSGIFTGEASQRLGGSFDNDADNNIFKATFGGSFGSLSFGNVAQTGLSEEFVLNDLSVVGLLAGGGDLGNVDLVYVPEPSSVLLMSVALAIGLVRFKRISR